MKLEAINSEQVKREIPALGVWFNVLATVEKVHDPESDIWVRWMRRYIDIKPMMFIGVRQVREGIVVDHEQYDYEQGYLGTDRYFRATRFITVWLFVVSAHSKPVHVLPSDAILLGSE